MKRYAVGIDAGKTTGVALMDVEKGIWIDYFSTTFWGAFWHEWEGFDSDNTMYVIEKPRKGFMYPSHGKNKFLSQAVTNNISFKAGENNREASLMIAGFTELNYEVEAWTPRTKKWNAKQLIRYTGITSATNEHVRDAIKILWERFVRDNGKQRKRKSI